MNERVGPRVSDRLADALDNTRRRPAAKTTEGQEPCIWHVTSRQLSGRELSAGRIIAKLFSVTERISFSGDAETGKSALRKETIATVGFQEMQVPTGKPSKGLMRMLGPREIPGSESHPPSSGAPGNVRKFIRWFGRIAGLMTSTAFHPSRGRRRSMSWNRFLKKRTHDTCRMADFVVTIESMSHRTGTN